MSESTQAERDRNPSRPCSIFDFELTDAEVEAEVRASGLADEALERGARLAFEWELSDQSDRRLLVVRMAKIVCGHQIGEGDR